MTTAPTPPLATILVVDDDPVARELMSAILGPAGYDVITVDSGARAIGLLEQGTTPDAVVCDVMMPGMHGLDVVEAVRAGTGVEDVPWLFVTAFDDRRIRLDAFEQGADGFLVKPVDSDELVARVNAIIQLSDRRRGSALARPLADAVEHAGEAIGHVDGPLLVLANQALRGLLGIDTDMELPVPLGEVEVVGGRLTDGPGLAAPWSGVGRTSTYAFELPGHPTTWVEVGEQPLRHGEGRLLHSRVVTEEVQGRTMAQSLVDAVSHELRTPLTAIQGALDLLDRARLEAPYDDVVRLAGRGVQRLGLLVDRVASFAAMSRSDLAERGVLLDGPALEAALHVELDGQGALVDLTGYRPSFVPEALLRDAIPELVGNARQAAGPEGSVEVLVRVESGRLVVLVTDDGPGLPSSETERAFVPLHQFDPSGQAPGVGLGLPMVRAAARGCGGSASLASRVGGPTTATVWIPRAGGGR